MVFATRSGSGRSSRSPTRAPTRDGPEEGLDSPGHDHEEQGFTAVALSHEGDIDALALAEWLEGLVMRAEAEVVRIKAVLALEGCAHRYVVQGVDDLLDGEFDRSWRGPRRSRLVVIGLGLDDAALRAGFSGCAAGQPAQSKRER